MEEEIQQVAEIYRLVTEFLVTYSFQILGALVILVVGLFVARKTANFVFNFLQKRNFDITLSKFTSSGLRIAIIVMVAVMALGKIGISVTPFVAAIGALGLGAGLALQGLLSNYGAGVGIIVSRPFVVGDTINVKGVNGIVREVRLAYTILSNEDEVDITIPNRHIMGEIIHNSHEDSIVELSVGIAYHCDPVKAITAIKEGLTGLEGVSDSREPQIGIEGFGDSSIDLGIRFWARTKVLYQSKYRANLAIHQALAANDIEIPFPQRDVHMIEAGTQQ